MANECSVYYNKIIAALTEADIVQPEQVFWAGVFAGICEQVMMKVKPAGMVTSYSSQAEESSRIVADAYKLHRERLDKSAGGFEIWVCRPDDAETQRDIARLMAGGLDWGEYHALRGRLCGYTDDVIRTYTEGVWP